MSRDHPERFPWCSGASLCICGLLPGRFLQAFLHVPFEGYRVVVLCITGAVEQSDVIPASCLDDGLQSVWLRIKLGTVAVLKLVPPDRIVSKPEAQIFTGSHVLESGFHLQRCFLHAARPKPFHKKTGAVSRLG